MVHLDQSIIKQNIRGWLSKIHTVRCENFKYRFIQRSWKNGRFPTFFVALIICAVFAVFLVLSQKLESVATAAGTAVISFTPGTAYLPPDTVFTVNIDSQTDTVAFVKTQIKFDPALLRLTGEVDTSNLFKTVIRRTNMTDANNTGIIDLVLAVSPEDRFNPPGGSFEVANLPFTAIGILDNVNTAITFQTEEIQIVSLAGEQLNVVAASSNVIINFSPSPTQQPQLTTTPVPSPTSTVVTTTPTSTLVPSLSPTLSLTPSTIPTISLIPTMPPATPTLTLVPQISSTLTPSVNPIPTVINNESIVLDPSYGSFPVDKPFSFNIDFTTLYNRISGIALRLTYIYSGVTPEVEVERVAINPQIVNSTDWVCPTNQHRLQGSKVVIDIACANISGEGYKNNISTRLATIYLIPNRIPLLNPLILQFDPSLTVMTRKSDGINLLVNPQATARYLILPSVSPSISHSPSPTLHPTNTPIPSTTISEDDPSVKLVLKSLSDKIKVGENVTFKAELLSNLPISGVEAVVNYDKRKLKIKNVRQTDLLSQNQSFSTDEQKGQIRLTQSSLPDGFRGKGVFAYLEFEALQTGKTAVMFEFRKNATDESNVFDNKSTDVLTKVQGRQINILPLKSGSKINFLRQRLTYFWKRFQEGFSSYHIN